MKQLYHKYMGNVIDRTMTMTAFSFVVNGLTGVGKLMLGIYLDSVWFIVNALYYLALCLARGCSLKKSTKIKENQNGSERYKMECAVYRHNGFLLCLLSIVYSGVYIRMFEHGDATVYDGYIVYLVALIAFMKLGFAIHGSVTAKKMKSPIVSSLKAINIADALAAIVVTECTLLTMEETAGAAKYSAITGMVFSLFILITGIKMTLKRKNAML